MGWLTRPYQRRQIPAINLTNTDRLQQLVRAGNLYLSGQDVIALALENNLDIEIQRYGPLLYREVTKRAEGGGLLTNCRRRCGSRSNQRQPDGCQRQRERRRGRQAAVTSQGGILTQLGYTAPSLDPALSVNCKLLPHHQPTEQHRSDRHDRAYQRQPVIPSGLFAKLYLRHERRS